MQKILKYFDKKIKKKHEEPAPSTTYPNQRTTYPNQRTKYPNRRTTFPNRPQSSVSNQGRVEWEIDVKKKIKKKHEEPAPSTTYPNQRTKYPNRRTTFPNRPQSSVSNQGRVEWEIDVESKDPAFKDLKWKLISEAHACNNIVSFLRSRIGDKLYVGFDIEWDPCFVKGQYNRTALLQISIHTGHSLLLQVSKMRQLPSSLTKLLTDPNILKVGVGIYGDVVKIKNDFGIQVQGWLDLSKIAPKAPQMGLAALSEDHLNVFLPKSRKIVMSKWSRELSLQKRAYAARDAYVAVLLLPKLVSMKLQIPESCVTHNDILECKKMSNGR